jgi:small multidrug resistance pump
MTSFWLVVLTGLTLFTAVGDTLLKKAGEGKNADSKLLLGGLFIYLCTGLIWFMLYKENKFSISGAVYAALMTLIFTVIGISYFHESLRPSEIAGIMMAIGSVILLSRFGS